MRGICLWPDYLNPALTTNLDPIETHHSLTYIYPSPVSAVAVNTGAGDRANQESIEKNEVSKICPSQEPSRKLRRIFRNRKDGVV